MCMVFSSELLFPKFYTIATAYQSLRDLEQFTNCIKNSYLHWVTSKPTANRGSPEYRHGSSHSLELELVSIMNTKIPVSTLASPWRNLWRWVNDGFLICKRPEDGRDFINALAVNIKISFNVADHFFGWNIDRDCPNKRSISLTLRILTKCLLNLQWSIAIPSLLGQLIQTLIFPKT